MVELPIWSILVIVVGMILSAFLYLRTFKMLKDENEEIMIKYYDKGFKDGLYKKVIDMTERD